eukprot:10157296-Alexandrium_andersonii.AAC.1
MPCADRSRDPTRPRSTPGWHVWLGRPRSRGLPRLKWLQRRSGVASEASTSWTRRIPMNGTTWSRKHVGARKLRTC